MTDLSPAQLDLIEHATGRNYTPKRDRNWLLVDGKDRDLCREMCVAGLMIEGETVDMFDGETHFTVTSAGVTAYLRQRPEKRISRGRQRYLSWLREDSGLRFGDWLKERHGKAQQ